MRSLAVLGVVLGCTGGPTFPTARFFNAPPVTRVNDRRDVAVRPAERVFMSDVYHYDGIFQRRITRALELPRPQRALGVNALDEVPDSTWFENRIGVRTLTPDEVGTGPLTVDSPERHLPWTIRSTKIGGTALGYIIKDARGVKWLLKFDDPAFPEVESGAHVIVNRILWACGYNVPEDLIVYLRPDDLVVAPDAAVKDNYGHELRRLDRAEVDRALAPLERGADGRIRALASRWLDGKALGGHPAEGVRADDPNDRIAHQLRRDLRGAYTIFAWLDHEDVQEGNFLDAWIQDPADAHRHYVKHYLIDFGKSLGAMAGVGHDARRGHTYLIDFAASFKSLATAGMIERSWERRTSPVLRGIGLFEAAAYDPGAWHPDSPSYVPFLTADDLDKLWGARLVMRFTPDQIRAAVAAARYSDPRSAAYVADTLVARQQATGRYWFARAAPLDQLELKGTDLCFDDLALTSRLTAGHTRYAVTAFDWSGHAISAPVDRTAAPGGRSCTSSLSLAADNGGYTIVRIEALRDGVSLALYVHLAREPSSGAPRIIGIWRP